MPALRKRKATAIPEGATKLKAKKIRLAPVKEIPPSGRLLRSSARNAPQEVTPAVHSSPTPTPPLASSNPRAPPRNLILTSLAAGGYGSIYETTTLNPPSRLIVKVLQLDNLHHSQVWMPMAEIRALKRIQAKPHKYVAQQPEVVEGCDPIWWSSSTGLLYMAFERYREDLNTISMAWSSLKPEFIRTIAMQTVQGLNHLHSLGIIHRDLKADNILVDDLGNCRIIDFGAASVSLTKTKPNEYQASDYPGMFTYPFFAPETVKKVRIPAEHDTDSDIEVGYLFNETSDFFSLGMMLDYLMYGTHNKQYNLLHCQDCFRDMHSDMKYHWWQEKAPADICDFINGCCVFHVKDRFDGEAALAFFSKKEWYTKPKAKNLLELFPLPLSGKEECPCEYCIPQAGRLPYHPEESAKMAFELHVRLDETLFIPIHPDLESRIRIIPHCPHVY